MCECRMDQLLLHGLDNDEHCVLMKSRLFVKYFARKPRTFVLEQWRWEHLRYRRWGVLEWPRSVIRSIDDDLTSECDKRIGTGIDDDM